ncbi:MAG TPA: nucleoside hydrolase [bacterium]|nr:nucleoside hydrolase [bacterium]HOL35294.1 nucleoside hydrolase [bacterium]HPP08835.1 nucleoside hydrolase [bacterium]
MKKKVILDTDIGSDIDDAICLAYLLSHPQCDLIGITTVTGEPEKRAMIASYLCEKAGRNIPIFPGMAEPIVGQQKQKFVPQYQFLEKIAYKKSFQGEWFNFLRNTIRQYPGEINLITIGPLTNIGTLFRIDPELPRLLKSMYIMGGMFFGENKKVEWNISCDPFAAHSVFSSNIEKIFVCGLDVTTKVKMGKTEIIQKFNESKILKEVLHFADIWFTKRDVVIFHDILAASVLFEGNICKFKKGKVFVEQLGQTGFIEDEKGNTCVAYDVNSHLFFSHFFDIVKS